MVRDTILYNRLEVQPNATDTEIKKNYKKLAIKWHPDKNPNNIEEATKKFQEIGEAYAILSDKEKRNMYDQIGVDILKQGGEGPTVNPADIFSQFFGGFGGPSGFPFGGFGHNRAKKKLENIIVPVYVTLEQIYNEQVVPVKYKQKIYCDKCDSNGTKNGKKSTCLQCDGKGIVVQIIRMGPMIQQRQTECPKCHGKGSYIEENNKCNKCSGAGYTIKNKMIKLPLENGLSHDQKIQVEHKGHHFKKGRTDLIVVIQEKEHHKFKREGNNLILNVELEMYQSLFGFDKVIQHLDNRKLHISHMGITKPDTIRLITDEGFKNLSGGGYGDMYLKFKVKYPNFSKNTDDEMKSIKELLAKSNLNEVVSEHAIKTEKVKTVKTVLRDYQPHQQQYEDMNEGPAQCVQQ